jgi:cytochrome P450
MPQPTLPPGSRLPGLAQAALFGLNPYAWLLRNWRRYGDCFSVRFPFFGDLVYVANPALVKQVFTGDTHVFHAGEANAIPLGPVMGTYSLLTLDEDEHLRQRKLLLPPFHGEAVRRYGELIEQVSERAIDRWPMQREFALRPSMQEITLEVILRAVFGVRDEARLQQFTAAFTGLERASNALLVLPLMRLGLDRFGPLARFKRAVAATDALIYDEIARRRAEREADAGDDVLSTLLAARHQDGGPMSDQELRDELMTLLGAGHETSATGLSWAFERLLRTPAALERLTHDPDDDAYLDAVVKETLRVRPVIVDVARLLKSDTQIGDWLVPAGTVAVPAITVMHMRPDLWSQPEAFRPERFLDGEGEAYAWIPFGGGVRRCIGAAFAQFEMKIVLRTIMRRARLRAADPAPEPPRIRHVTTVPAKGARVVLLERRSHEEARGRLAEVA